MRRYSKGHSRLWWVIATLLIAAAMVLLAPTAAPADIHWAGGSANPSAGPGETGPGTGGTGS